MYISGFKKIGITFLILLYGITQMRLNLELHSCLGRITSWNILGQSKCPCEKKNSISRSNSCCKTQILNYTMQDCKSESKNFEYKSPLPPSSFSLGLFLRKNWSSNQNPKIILSKSKHPQAPAPYLLFHSFRV